MFIQNALLCFNWSVIANNGAKPKKIKIGKGLINQPLHKRLAQMRNKIHGAILLVFFFPINNDYDFSPYLFYLKILEHFYCAIGFRLFKHFGQFP